MFTHILSYKVCSKLRNVQDVSIGHTNDTGFKQPNTQLKYETLLEK
jgi:hypothetical protein